MTSTAQLVTSLRRLVGVVSYPTDRFDNGPRAILVEAADRLEELMQLLEKQKMEGRKE